MIYMIKAQEQIDKMKEILDKANVFTPQFVNGLLIPRELVESFYYCISNLFDMALKSEEYFDLMWKGEQVREKMKFDMINGLVKMASKGMIGEKKAIKEVKKNGI